MADEATIYQAENTDPLSADDAFYHPGDHVIMTEDAELYAGEEVVIVSCGKGKGPFYTGRQVYDIASPEEHDDGAEEIDTWRVTEDAIEGLV